MIYALVPEFFREVHEIYLLRDYFHKQVMGRYPSQIVYVWEFFFESILELRGMLLVS